MESPLLRRRELVNKRRCRGVILVPLGLLAIAVVGYILGGSINGLVFNEESKHSGGIDISNPEIVESEKGVVAADDGRCSEIGASMLRQGGHAVDAAVATALCLGVVGSMWSGIGGGGFMLVRSASTLQTTAIDFRETAPLAASQDMYETNVTAKSLGPLSIAVPGEIAGLHEAWLRYGRLAWRSLFEPAIKLAKDGFVISPYVGQSLVSSTNMILNDPGLRRVYAPNGKIVQAGDTCYNVELGKSLEAVADQGPQAFYNGAVGEKLVKDVREAGGILSMEDLRNYTVEVTEAMTTEAMGYTVHGMPPPSSGTLGFAMVMNIFKSYNDPDATKGNLGLHRLIEALKHMYAERMNLGDPRFSNISNSVSNMLSPSFAKKIQEKIIDNTTFPPDYYQYRWSQLRDSGTSHFCIVDAERNAVSLTTTVNEHFGAGLLSPSTGIVLNNEMGDFSVPTDISPDKLPPAPANFIQPNKRPLSSMIPLIVTKDDRLIAVLGGSGGMKIIPAVIQVFLNYFSLGFQPFPAVERSRVYHQLIPNVVKYENLTFIDGDHVELSDEKTAFLEERGHKVVAIDAPGAIVQFIVQNFEDAIDKGRKGRKISNDRTHFGVLTAVCDPRKNGNPAVA
ncbi:glutathione hydrolase 3-like isoform X1 [Cucurbita pepo subsp. pepo]|uniref:glutathione hydrolase 3-like isoform X1 n=2 Tax=Cucurbita pepo subsp. pepo TaxID=3664 RepID=UPI000C9D3DE9|nr:glutathione hydrolase 3-like isoform X1 [Cucurbita pepo subsp. pepo]